jgi:hypothetical protein
MIKKCLIVLLFISVSSCLNFTDDGDPPISSAFTPEIISRAAFNESIVLAPAKAIEETGKIYVIGNYLFINEPYEGFHVMDNTDPANPNALKFLNTPGATDLIFKGDSFYVNQAVDLVALKFNTDISAVAVTERIEDVFPQILSPDGFDANAAANEIVINWN